VLRAIAPRTQWRLAGTAAAALVAGLVLLAALPALAGFDETLERLRHGEPAWLGVAVGLELVSYAGYVALLRTVARSGGATPGWRISWEITLAGVAATRLLAAGGAGGIALTAWALHRAGMTTRAVTETLATFFVALYGVFFGVMALTGAGLSVGLLAGPDPRGLTVLPALVATAVIAAALGCAAAAAPLDDRLDYAATAATMARRVARRAAAIPGILGCGVHGTMRLVRARSAGLLGAVIWWAGDIAVLWACLHAFGGPPQLAVVGMAYVVGQLGNLLPLPGGVGGVEGGLVAALLGFGVDGGLAVVAVLSYRAISFWLPTPPGAIALGTLHRHLSNGA
jgi:uncharacterized membrane protein YbhN (UPF0104 family)